MKALEKYKLIRKYFLLVSHGKIIRRGTAHQGRFCRLKCILVKSQDYLPCRAGFGWQFSDNHN